MIINLQFISAGGAVIFSLCECHTKIPFEECNAKLEIVESVKPSVVSDSLSESCSDCVVRIGTFTT